MVTDGESEIFVTAR